MKSMGFYLLTLALLAFLGACGKNNESGKNSWQYGNPYYSGQNPYGIPTYHNAEIQRLAANYPCQGQGNGFIPYGQSPYPGMPPIQNGARTTIQIPLTANSTIISSIQPYIGVTGYGDIAVITSAGPNQPPVFTAYLCPRSFAQSGQGQLLGVKVGANALRCKTNPAIIAADVILPGGLMARFRSLDGGVYNSCMGYAGSPYCQYSNFQTAGLCF